MKNIYRWLLALALLPTLGSVHAASPVVSQAGGACLVADGTTARLGACNGQTAQGFTFSNAGTVISGGLCLEVDKAKFDTSVRFAPPVRFAPCSNGSGQAWKRDGDFLVSAPHGVCLRALPSKQSVVLDTCAYNADRKWNVAGLHGNWPLDSTPDKPKPTAAVAGASLNSAQLEATVNWIYAETRLDNEPFCWKKDGYDRGSGIAPSECPAGKVNQSGLCYDPPRNGYGCTGITCSQNCPSGYHSTGTFTCTYSGSKTYSKTPYAIPLGGCQRSRFQYGGFCYNREDDGSRCRSGYAMQVAGICSFQGAWDTTRGTYTRAGGTLPGGCLSNRVKEVGMCYAQPRDGYTCTVTVCSQKCASGTLDCGAGCARDVGTCSASITDMVVSPAIMLASLATSGAAGAAANSVRAGVKAAKEAASKGADAAHLALILRDSINDYMNAAEGNLASISTPEVEAQVAAKYGKGSANYRLIARQYALLQILAAVRDLILQLDILAISMIDATGVVSTINAFAKPLCEQHKPIP